MNINYFDRRRVVFPIAFFFLLSLLVSQIVVAQPIQPSESGSALYQQLQSPALTSAVQLKDTVLQRDRVRISFTGTLYLGPVLAGKVRSAVFIGSGSMQAAPPPVLFEQENVRRLLKADDVSSDFRTAVLRFTDDSADELLKGLSPSSVTAPQEALQLESELSSRLLKETGANIAARQLVSILNQETPGVFLAHFAGGKRGRFTYVFDPQTRIPVANFDINAGEKGIIFTYDGDIWRNDVWMAFDSNEDYAKGVSSYSDAHDLVSTDKYTLKLNLLEPHKALGMTAKLDLVSLSNGVQVIPFAIGEELSTWEDDRLRRQMKVVRASLADGTPLACLQEPWEQGFSIVLPKAAQAGELLSLNLELKGDFMREPEYTRYRSWGAGTVDLKGMYFPRGNVSWYPRHGSPKRSKFDIIMLHRKKDNVVAVGERVKEEPAPDMNDALLTEFRMEQPVPFATFAVGPYEIHKDAAKQESGRVLPIEFYSMPGDRFPVKEDFILAELNNSIRYFSKFFGEYPYPVFRGVFHPFGFGQGFATTIMMPNADQANYDTFSFIAHETSHQWWGDQVLWRSYQDQWLSEGFARYSGILYVGLRQNPSAKKELIERSRKMLKEPPSTLQGISKGRLVDVGPLIIGHRAATRESLDAYTALAYEKGGLVLRMLHYLFSDPQSGDGQAFVNLMNDFAKKYNESTATSWQFFEVANERVKDTPLARRYGYKDLNWFYRQWVLQAYLPSYELTYHVEDQPDGTAVIKGEVLQQGVPENDKWFMPLPLLIHFPGGGEGHATVAALGSHTPVNLRLPKRPEKVELDPELWVLSDKTSINRR